MGHKPLKISIFTILRSRTEGISTGAWFYRPEDFLRKTQWLILWRLVFISLFLLLTVILQEKGGLFLFPFAFSRLYFLIGLQYFFSILYITFLFWEQTALGIAVLQLLLDGFFVTAVVYLTGGIESFFPYLYFLIILSGGILFYRLGGLVTALGMTVWYGLLLALQGMEKIPFYYGRVVQPAPYSKNYFLYQILMHGLGFFFIGYVSGIFAEQARKQRGQIEDQRKDIDRLEELNRIVIENLDFGLITLNYENKIRSVNPAGEKILGRRSEELKNLPLIALFPNMEEVLGLEGPALKERRETSYLNPEGSPVTLGYSFSPVKEGQPHGIGRILSFKDISQIKAMEDHLRRVDRLALMGKMAAGIAHEIRNPLASISGSIQVLKDDIQENKIGERLLKIISREVVRLDSLVNDFLAFAKPVQEIELPLDIAHLIEGTVELIKKNKEVPSTIIWKEDVRPHLLVYISAWELSQILWNLLTNALQAVSAKGEIFIGARHIRSESLENWIEIKVGDTGPGIPEKDQARIFEPFFTTKGQGTGLGLSIVQKIVSDRRGRIRVENSPGQGTEFIILFPEAADRKLTTHGGLS